MVRELVTTKLEMDSFIRIKKRCSSHQKLKEKEFGVHVMAQLLSNLTSNHEDSGLIRGLTPVRSVSDIAMSRGVGHRCSLDPTLLWLCCRLAAAASV